MKKIISAFLVTAAFLMSTAFSCGDDNIDSIQFPEEQTLTIAAGQEETLNFHAVEKWKLVSSAPWVKFIDANMEVFDISGLPGDQSVKVKVLESGQGFTETEAQIKLNMGGMEKVIAKVIRGAKSYSVKITDEEGNEVKELVITNSVYTVFHVETNFEFTSNVLDQLDFMAAVAGEAGKDLKTGIMVKNDYITRPIEKADNVNLEIYNGAKEVIASYPILYKGVDESYIGIYSGSGNKWIENEMFQHVVSFDGKTFTSGLGKYDKMTGKIIESSLLKSHESITLKVVARNDAYKFIMFESDDNGKVVRPSSEWIHAVKETSDPQLVKVTVDPSSVIKRTGAVIAVPEAVYNTVNQEITTGIYYQKVVDKYKANILVEAFQMDDDAQELDLRNGLTWNRLYGYEKISEAEELSFCKEKFGTDNAFVANVAYGTSLLIFTRYHESSIDKPNVFDGYEIYNTDGTFAKDLMDKTKTEYSLWDDWFMCYVNVKSVGLTRDMYVKLKTKTPAADSENVQEKVLKVVVFR